MNEEHKKKLREMLCDIRDELEGAEHYQDIATHLSIGNDASAYKDMAQQELNHAKVLCEMTTRWVQQVGDPVLQAVWDFEHEGFMEWKGMILSKSSMR